MFSKRREGGGLGGECFSPREKKKGRKRGLTFAFTSLPKEGDKLGRKILHSRERKRGAHLPEKREGGKLGRGLNLSIFSKRRKRTLPLERREKRGGVRGGCKLSRESRKGGKGESEKSHF